MPRNGSGVASKPAGTTFVPNTTIESAKVNSVINDIYALLNDPLPITAGGTGATSKQGAIDGIFDGTAVIDDADLRISDPSDRTKIVRLDAGLVTTGTVRVLTAPDRDINLSSVPRGHIYGLTLSNNGTDATNDIDIAAGEAASDDTAPHMIVLSSALTKRLDAAWAVGTGNGGLDAGTIADTTYHVWLIQRSDTGVKDALFSTSATSPTMPTNYDRKRRIGSILRESGAIVLGNWGANNRVFKRRNAKLERDSTSSTGGVDDTQTLSVPSGISVRPIISSQLAVAASSNTAIFLGDGDAGTAGHLVQQVITPAAVTSTDTTVISHIATNTSRQIYINILLASGTITTGRIRTYGWFDDGL